MSKDKKNPEQTKASQDAETQAPDQDNQVSTTAQESGPSPEEKTSSSPESLPPSVRPKKSRGGLWFMFVLILLLAAFSGGGYLAYVYLQEQRLESEELVAKDIARMEQNFAQLRDANNSLAGSQTNLQRALTALSQDSEAQILALAERISATESKGSADWTLAEVEYLLRIANQRLVTSRDTETAVEMLQTADSILRELPYPELVPVRRQLSEDIAKLQLANNLDVEGLYFELESLALEVDGLEGFDPEYIEEESFSGKGGQSALSNLWNSVRTILNRYIRLQTNAGEPQYLITEEQRVARLLTVQLQLRQAQLALLSSRQEIFSASLSSAANSINLFYARSDKGKVMVDRLDELSDTRLEKENLDISESIRALSSVVNQLSRLEEGQ